MSKFPNVLLICLLLSYTHSQVCGTSDPSDKIQSGSYSVSKQNSAFPRLHTYNIQINNFQVTNNGFQVAVSTSSINGYNPFNGFDYKVSGGKQAGGNGLILSLFITQNESWASLRLSYLVSAWLDIIVGSFIGDPFDSSNAADFPNGVGVLESYIPIYRLKSNVEYSINAFISGFRTDAKSFNIYLIAQAIDKTDGRIVVQFQSNANPSIEVLQISYVIYPKQHTLYTFIGGNGLYQLSGPQNIQRTNINNNIFSMCKKGGITCPNGQVFSNGVCQCPNGFILVLGACYRQCSLNAYINSQNRCVCIPGYEFNNQNVCVTLPKCFQNQILVNAICVCVQGYSRNSTGICNPNCPGNEVFNGTHCICVGQFYTDSRGVCLPIPNCPQNQQWSANQRTCICINGFIRNQFNQCISQITCRANQVLVNSQCVCQNGYSRNNFGLCVNVTICKVNEIYNVAANRCDCTEQFVKLGENCISRCQINNVWVNGSCVCKEGYAWILNACRQCPAGSYQSTDKATCICQNQNSIFKIDNVNSFRCQQCGQFSSPDSTRTKCNCFPGYQLNTNTNSCIRSINCPINSSPNQSGVCICFAGLYMENNVCRQQPVCPVGSVWNQGQLECQCTNPTQYLINGICRACGQNQAWNSKQCVCRSGFFKIAGICRTCDPRTTYNGQDCICNVNFYGNRDKCDPCHATCSKCSGSSANQCIQCVDISYTLQSGYCIRQTPCTIGSFLNPDGVCQPCIENCRDCAALYSCTECAPGFIKKNETIFNQVVTYCQAICGDGKKNDAEECDDNNTINGDGCNNKCKIQSGWSCSGGSSIKKSTCNNFIPTRTIIELKGAVVRVQNVYQSVKLSYIPTCFTDLGCADCFSIIKVSVIAGGVPVQVLVEYVPNSEGQFLVQFRFPGINTSAFTFTVSINSNLSAQYRNCFSAQDYDQRVTRTIDPALLVRVNQDTALTSLDITNPDTILNSQNLLEALDNV